MKIVEVITYEGPRDVLVWKHPSEDFNTLSQLIVHETQEAILFKNGAALDLFGPGRHTLTTANIPLLRKLVNLPFDGVSPFHCEVYFINRASSLNIKWGTNSQIDVLDAQFGIPIHVGASGAMGMRVSDSRKLLLKLVGTEACLNIEQFSSYFRDVISTRVKHYIARIMSEVSYLAVAQYLEDISTALHDRLKTDLEEYGVSLENFYVSTIAVPEDDKRKVKEVLETKLEYGQLGYNWADEQLAAIAKAYASNPGSADNIGNVAAQMPLAFAFGNMLTQRADPILETLSKGFSGGSSAFGTNGDRGTAFGPNKGVSSDWGIDSLGSISDVHAAPADSKSDENPVCPNCKAPVPVGARFCCRCGAHIVPTTCPNCHEAVSPDMRFCPSCGAKLGE